MNSVCSTDKRTGRWKKYGRTGPLSALAKWFYIHKDARVSEWIWDSAESKPRRPSSSLPRRGTYQITLSLSVWSVISWKTRSDVTDGAHGERAAEDEDMLGCRQTSSETGERAGTRGGAGRRFYFYFPAFSLQKIPWMQDKKTPEVKEFSICWITLMYILEPRSCQLSSDVSAAFFNNN